MANKTILLKGDPLRKEAVVSTAQIYPGMLIMYVTNDDTVKPHNVESGNAAAMVAIENSLEGQEVGTVYAVGDRCQYVHLRPGDEFMALLADSETVAVGTFLESDGAGSFQAFVADSSAATIEVRNIVAQALEAITGSSTSGALIKAVCV